MELVSKKLPVSARLLKHHVELSLQIADNFSTEFDVFFQFLLVFCLCLCQIELELGLKVCQLLITDGHGAGVSFGHRSCCYL